MDLEEHCDVGGDSRPASVWWRGHSCEIRAQEQQDECFKRLNMPDSIGFRKPAPFSNLKS